MKKLFVLLALLVLIGGLGFGQEAVKPFDLVGGGGLYYDAYPLTGTAFDILLVLFNLRGEAYGTFLYNLSDMVAVGAEVGLAYITASSGSYSSSLIDVPLRAVGSFNFSFITLQPYVGALFTFSSSNDPTYTGTSAANLEVGARVVLGGLTGVYAEAGYVLGTQSFARFGLGYQLKLLNF